MVLGIFVLSLVSPVVVQSQQKKGVQKINVAVMDFTARGGISGEEAATLSDVFQSKLANVKQVTLVDRNRIKSILQEQGFQQSEACSQVECLVEAGRILKVEKMFAGSIGKVGKIYNVTIQLIDVQTAQILQTMSRQHSGDIEELVSDVVPEMADQIAGQLVGEGGEYEAVSRSGGGSSWLWYVVGGAVVAGGVAAVVLTQDKGEAKTPTMNQGQLPESPSFP